MLDVCHNVGSSLDIALNSSRLNHIYLWWVLVLLCISLGLTLAVMIIQWTDRLKYLLHL